MKVTQAKISNAPLSRVKFPKNGDQPIFVSGDTGISSPFCAAAQRQNGGLL
ncbi:MAG: hypothetical protein IJB94_01825 [Clostridia bacterium]|nr:hypothetical protein [Clostridia bacterium]